ncbi:nuclear transport factor 2 family protein [Chitinophaga sp. HK235]|uniref:nuclear transport factor 2 family protein n=1 Tax=Chitinophaga sp. HK235 TaxID=2952571 RepID=UPI001BAA7EB9|nr:nuclear transport factor 2 family protein [Chitinophaga sp. HK235]
MKALLLCIALSAHITSFAQSKVEKEIRNLEQLELATIHKGDTIGLLKIWSKDFVVNNPYGQIVTVPQIFQLIREGKIDYATVERIVDKVSFIEDVAVSMGKEIITPQNETAYAGKKVTRQYTNIWLKTKEGWRMIARQATIVSMQ